MRGILKWLRILVIVLAIVAGLIGVIGLALPKAHEATRSARIAAPAEAIYPVLIVPEGYPQWRPDVERVERLDSDRFREFGENGPMVFRITDRQPGARVVVMVDDPEQPFTGTWTIELIRDGDAGQQTRVRITERGAVPNPFFRAIARLMMLPAASIEVYLKNLGRRFGQDVTIEP